MKSKPCFLLIPVVVIGLYDCMTCINFHACMLAGEGAVWYVM